ncbi:MAG: class I SAM-dependent methyltransferase [Synechococcaceae cyanobacterium SM2_3_1]|nr:class I SAM-dependent methyltransferase [Synechococcaceae cyanobacterium SM2_3_1]
MKFQDISAMVGHVPFITRKNGQFLYDLIIREQVKNILELGFAHGTATCYMAAALQELGEGSIVAVDLIEAKNSLPLAEDQLEKVGLSEFATVIRMQTGYTWFLHDDIVRNTSNDTCDEVYDLCVIDGAKNWTIDTAAFFLVDKLLRKNGWIIFDDYNWTYASADNKRDSTDGITHRSLSQAEQEIPHIREIFELLVKQHPHYGNLLVLEGDDWALAQKTVDQEKIYNIIYREATKEIVIKAFNKVIRSFKSLR